MSNTCYPRVDLHELAAPSRAPGARPWLLKALVFGLLCILFPLLSYAQTREVSGKVLDGSGSGLPGVTVIVPGTTVGTSTGGDGGFSLQVPPTATTLSFSFVGYATQVVNIEGKNTVSVSLKDDSQALGDVVVVGYGSVQKTDLTGAVSALSPKDFNKGTFTSPDQLIQGRTSGVQVTQNSGQPGGASTIRIRGNSAVTGTGQPLYVVDGVPLDGRSARPGLNTAIGDSPDSNPLNFLNPADIESITILKDASATAIYGSRAAYGVVLITTKRGKTGEPKLDINASAGFSHILRRINVLNADQFRQALTYYGAPATNDLGQNNDPLGAILRTAAVQNYNAAVSGGTENARYRLSLGYLDQEGIVKKTDFKKYTANFVTNAKFLESKRLGVDINITASQSREQLAPITNNGDYRGSLIGQALQWNPTDRLYNDDGSPFVRPGQVINPVAQLEYYNDNARVTTALASISPYYKFTDWLEYRALVATNYSTGLRRTSIDQRLNIQDYLNLGYAAIGTSELQTQQTTHTLNFNKKLGSDLNVNALLGYEYTQYNYSGTNLSGRGPVTASGTPIGFGAYGLDYTNYLQYSNPSGRLVSSFVDPVTRLQSVFARAILNYKERYLLTATIRRDGSTKFGDNHQYGYFPSISAAWDISQEDFFKNETVNQMKLRVGYGRTGNQEFPAGSARNQFVFLPNNGGLSQTTNANADLKWQSDEQYDVGVDLGFFNNKVTLTADYFYKRTTDLLYPNIPGSPAAPGGSSVIWENLDGIIVNKGVELLAGVTAFDTPGFGLNFSANATFVRNSVSGLPETLVIQTGTLSGQGLSGVLAETIQNGQPLNGFRLPIYNGLNDNGFYNTFGGLQYAGNPNPTTLAGLSTTIRAGKLSLIANFNGVFGNKIYNNTFNSVLNVSQIRSGKNIALAEYQSGVKESLANAVTPSTRYLESGNFVRLSNLTLSYALGDFGSVFKGASIYAIGQNVFLITKYRGFDPEVNTNKNNGVVPSAGIDYTGYPSARTFTFGLNFSL